MNFDRALNTSLPFTIKRQVYKMVNRIQTIRLMLRITSSHSQMFIKIGILKNFAILTGKHLSWNLFLIKLQALSPVFNENVQHLRWLLL